MAAFQLANFFPNLVLLAIFHNKVISGPAKNIKICNKNFNILKADVKIHSRTISD